MFVLLGENNSYQEKKVLSDMTPGPCTETGSGDTGAGPPTCLCSTGCGPGAGSPQSLDAPLGGAGGWDQIVTIPSRWES